MIFTFTGSTRSALKVPFQFLVVTGPSFHYGMRLGRFPFVQHEHSRKDARLALLNNDCEGCSMHYCVKRTPMSKTRPKRNWVVNKMLSEHVFFVVAIFSGEVTMISQLIKPCRSYTAKHIMFFCCFHGALKAFHRSPMFFSSFRWAGSSEQPRAAWINPDQEARPAQPGNSTASQPR